MASTFHCRSCDSSEVKPFLSLGRTPLANSLLTEEQLDQQEEIFPLDVAFCARCSLVQILETAPPAKLFREYLYFSSFSDTMLHHAEAIASRIIRQRSLGAQSLAMEVASNDGYLLQYYKQAGIPVLGIEPALNIAAVAEKERGIRTIPEFFGEDLAKELIAKGERADVIHANNVLAHVPALNGFVEGIRLILKDDGVAVIEAPYLGRLIHKREFDTIYHEHLSYFSAIALEHLFRNHGLLLYDVEHLPIHGGSLRLFVARQGSQRRQVSVEKLLAEETAAGMNTFEYYQGFAGQVENLKGELLKTLSALKKEGKRLAAYGAAAKGSTLLNYFGVGKRYLDYVVDRSTYKQGRYMPGVRLPIYPPSKLLEDSPDYVLMLGGTSPMKFWSSRPSIASGEATSSFRFRK